MKIWSLLPSATEILFALGLDDQVTGVTHECDYPPGTRLKPQVTFSNIDSTLSAGQIDEQVRRHLAAGHALYGIDEDRLRADPPELIVTQDLCPVCAVSPTDLERHLLGSGCSAPMLTLNPLTIDDVLGDIIRIGDSTGRSADAQRVVDALQTRIEAVRLAVKSHPRKRVMCIEWLDPLMPGGHWVPEMVTIAGGEGGPIAPGEPSCKMSWEELRVEQPEVIVLMPCGFPPDRAAADSAALWHLDGWSELPAVQAGEVYCTDGNAYFSRPGPRLVEGIEILARALHGDAWAQPVPEGSLLKLAGVSSGGPEYTLVA